MTKQEIEKLERICKENGFDIKPYYTETDLFVIEPAKDEWEGVKFIEGSKGRIYKVKKYGSDGLFTTCGKFFDWHYVKDLSKKSTEQAYKDQLIDEAKKRFGEIRYGALFFNLYQNEFIEKIFFPEVGFSYEYDDDLLCFGNIAIYQNGKWAKRVEEIKICNYTQSVNGLVLSYSNPLSTLISEKDLEKIFSLIKKIINEKD
jgi:hypothetical protein